MEILLKDVLKNSMDFEGKVECEKIENNGDNIQIEDGINFNGILKKGMDFLEISGEVFAKIKTNCHLCGNEFETEIRFNIFSTYREIPSEEEYKLFGNKVNFDEMILENFRVNLPVKFICSENCKGICTVCGKNLNEGECNCKKDENNDSPFNVLNKLIDK